MDDTTQKVTISVQLWFVVFVFRMVSMWTHASFRHLSSSVGHALLNLKKLYLRYQRFFFLEPLSIRIIAYETPADFIFAFTGIAGQIVEGSPVRTEF